MFHNLIQRDFPRRTAKTIAENVGYTQRRKLVKSVKNGNRQLRFLAVDGGFRLALVHDGQAIPFGAKHESADAAILNGVQNFRQEASRLMIGHKAKVKAA